MARSMLVPPFPPQDEITSAALVGGSGTERHDSGVYLPSDGRVLYQYQANDGRLYQSYYPDWLAFARARNATATTPVLVSFGGGESGTKSTVYRMADGNLYMNVIYLRAGSHYFQVWKSTSGTGESSPGNPDWVLQSTILSGSYASFVNPVSGELDWSENDISAATAVGSRWVVSAPVPGGGFGSWITYLSGIWSSENGPAGPWTQRLSIGYPALSAGGYGSSRRIPIYNGNLWWSSSGNVNGSYSAYSSNGTSWTAFTVGGNSAYGDPIFAQDGVLYRLYTNPIGGGAWANTSFEAYAVATPPSGGGDPTAGIAPSDLIVQLLGTDIGHVKMYAVEGPDGKWVLVTNGYIICRIGREWWMGELGFN